VSEKQGRFIVLEGLEGAGKSTALTTIKRFVAPYAPEIVTTREPGGTELGEAIRDLIKKHPEGEPISCQAELLMFYAARVQLVEEVIRPALARGAWVIADRFELSTFAYQGGGRGIDDDYIKHLSQLCLGSLTPDLLLFLDLPPDVGLERIQNRGKTDRIEQESIDFFYRVYNAYHKHLKPMKQAMIIDASKPLAMVQHLIRAALEHDMDTHELKPL